MAGEDNLVSRLAALVAAFDDAAWEALASKGLLRRARKDLEKGLVIEIVEETAGTLEIKVSPFQVSIPVAGPAKASCTCPAGGICQHILAAGLYLQMQSAPATAKPAQSPEVIRDEVASYSSDRIKEWAGAADYRAGVLLLEKNSLPPTIEYNDTVLIRLMPGAVEARFVAGGGLDGMIFASTKDKRVAVATFLALRRSLGFEVAAAPKQSTLVDLSGTPRSRQEILSSAKMVLEDAITVGLSHVSPSTADRLLTLSVSAQGANLPRVSLALRTLSDEVNSLLRREARADESRLFLLAARVYALMEAIEKGPEDPSPEFAGVSRAQYVDVPEMELIGVGAYPWQTGSGYRGLTVLFWSSQTREFLSWSEARPANQQFDPRQRFFGEGPWEGSQSPRQVASSHLKLRNGRRTLKGRISGSKKTTALVLSASCPGTLDFGNRLFTSWNSLSQYVHNQQPLGLRDPNPLDMIVVLEPSAFGLRAFDRPAQTFTWEIYDEQDQMLVLSLPFREWHSEAIKVLEALAPPMEQRWRVLTRIAQRDGSLSLEPISILRPGDHPVFQLSFDPLPQVSKGMEQDGSSQQEDDADSPDEEALESEQVIGKARYLNRVVNELNRRMQNVAEAGCQSGVQESREWFRISHRETADAGLTYLAALLKSLSEPTPSIAPLILRARFVSDLHAQASGYAD